MVFFERLNRFWLVPALFATALGLQSCGGGGAGSSESTAQPPAALSLFAGVLGIRGNLDGPAGTARFSSLSALASDRTGASYVIDGSPHRLRKIAADGTVSTLAVSSGTGCAASGASVAFDGAITSLAVDSAGNVYLVQDTCHTVLKISPTGTVSVYAGASGVSGATDGPRESARFQYPSLITVDGSDNLYIRDWRGIRRITPDGTVSTYFVSATGPAGIDGPQGVATFFDLSGLAADAAGNLFATTSANTVRKLSVDRVVSTIAGATGVAGSSDGVGTAARFHFPNGIAVGPSGSLVVADTGNHTIRFITADGAVSTLAGMAGSAGSLDGIGAAARFKWPTRVYVLPDGRVLVVEQLGSSVSAVTAAGAVTTYAGARLQTATFDGRGDPALFAAGAIAVDRSGNAYVQDELNQNLRKIAPSAAMQTLATLPPAYLVPDEGAIVRGGLAVDASGNLFVGDRPNQTVLKLTPAGELRVIAGKRGELSLVDGDLSVARFMAPGALAMDGNGNLYVADATTIRRISASGTVSTVAGSLNRTSTIDGRGAGAAFTPPSGLAVDSKGTYLYVAESQSHVIRRIELASGLVTTVAGTVGLSGSADGKGYDARFNFPGGLAVDDAGNVYVADTGNHLIRKITTSGAVSTVAGVPGKVGFTAGSLPGALQAPFGVAIVDRKLFITMGSGLALIENLP